MIYILLGFIIRRL